MIVHKKHELIFVILGSVAITNSVATGMYFLDDTKSLEYAKL